MPYELRGAKVVRSDTGAVVKDHKGDRRKALAHLRALKANVEEGVLGSLLEGFDEAKHPRDFRGQFRIGDRVTYHHGLLGDMGARVTNVTSSRVAIHPFDPRASDTSMTHNQAAVKLSAVASGQHPEPTVGLPPDAANLMRARALDEVVNFGGVPTKKGDVLAALQKEGHSQAHIDRYMQGLERGRSARQGRRSLSGGMVREAFASPGLARTSVPETPQQSQVRGAAQVAAAQKELKAWDASKHPRAAGGRFGSKGGATSRSSGSKRARKAAGQPNVLKVGVRGPLVRALQRQLHIPVDGLYSEQTRAAVLRFQRQRGLQVDGEVGRQTLAALRGNPNARFITPGPIAPKAARVVTTRSKRKRHAARKHQSPFSAATKGGPNRMQGGTVI